MNQTSSALDGRQKLLIYITLIAVISNSFFLVRKEFVSAVLISTVIFGLIILTLPVWRPQGFGRYALRRYSVGMFGTLLAADISSPVWIKLLPFMWTSLENLFPSLELEKLPNPTLLISLRWEIYVLLILLIGIVLYFTQEPVHENGYNYAMDADMQTHTDLQPISLPDIHTKNPRRIYICHDDGDKADHKLAASLYSFFKHVGHEVYMMKHSAAVDATWLSEAKNWIKKSEYLIILLSEGAINNELVAEQIIYACDPLRVKESPRLLPIEVRLSSSVPYHLSRYLHRLKRAKWQTNIDTAKVFLELFHAIESGEPCVTNKQHRNILDLPIERRLPSPRPSPYADLHIVESLKMPGGTMKLGSPHYVERLADHEARSYVLQSGVTIRVKGSRQIGKSSLLIRLLDYATSNEYSAIYVDFQVFDLEQMVDLDILLKSLADQIAENLFVPDLKRHYWEESFGAKGKMNRFMVDYVLSNATKPIVLLLDEVDRIFSFDKYRNDFFSLIRYWHNRRAYDELWENLNIVLGYSTEAYLFIEDLNQSPFNVGQEFILADFSRDLVVELNERYGQPLQNDEDIDEMMGLVGGHPFLIQKIFYTLRTTSSPLDEILSQSAKGHGIFDDHLRRYLWWLNDFPELKNVLNSVIKYNECNDELQFSMLRSAGLVKGSSYKNVQARCELYAIFFARHI